MFLQNAIEVNNIFRDLEFWEELIKCNINNKKDSINEEFNHQSFSDKNEENKQMNENNIVFGQLITFSFQILTFDISKEKTKELIEKFNKFHNIAIDQKEQLYKQIDSYSKEQHIVFNGNIESVNTNFNSSTEKKESEEEEIIVID